VEFTHVELTSGDVVVWSMCTSVDKEATHTADTFATIVVESYRLFSFVDELLVENVHHFKEGSLGGDVRDVIFLKTSLSLTIFLSPYSKFKV
jgi:hypothetical protein